MELLNIPKTPSESGLNLPGDSWRAGQADLLQECLEQLTVNNAFIVEAPTGTGKSIFGLALSRLLNIPTVYLVATKQLQNQIKGIAKDNQWVKVLMGRNEYPCTRDSSTQREGRTAEECDKKSRRCLVYEDGRCFYEKAKKEALAAPVAVLNYAYFLTEANLVGQFSRANQLIISDEADLLERELMNFVELEVSAWVREKYGIGEPKYKTKWESWKAWAETEVGAIQLTYKDMLADKNLLGDLHYIKETNRLERLIGNMQRFYFYVDDTWIFDQHESKYGEDWVFKPTWISPFSQDSFFIHGGKHLMMSATIGDNHTFCKTIGLKLEHNYLSVDSPFPAENRPIYYWPVANLTHNSEADGELYKLYPVLQFLLDKYPNQKGLCHTVSYARAKAIMHHVSSGRWVLPPIGADGRLVVEEFKKSDKPLVLLTPALERGIDLPYDSCRWLVVTKIPFPSLADKQVNKRLYAYKDGDRWYAWETARRLIQATGRGVRAIDDRCDSWILDKQFERLDRKLFPGWWAKAIKERGE